MMVKYECVCVWHMDGIFWLADNHKINTEILEENRTHTYNFTEYTFIKFYYIAERSSALAYKTKTKIERIIQKGTRIHFRIYMKYKLILISNRNACFHIHK